MKKHFLPRGLSYLTATSVLALLLTSTSFQHSTAAVFDFESTPTTQSSFGASNGVPVLVVTNSSLTMTITRQNADTFNVTDLSPYTGAPASWGHRSLDPFQSNGVNTSNGFIANFSSVITFFSMQFGDFAFPDVDTLTLTAWSGINGTGTMIAQAVVTQTGAFPQFNAASVGGSGILSVTWSSTTPDPYPNSLFYDNFTTEGPAPGVPDAGGTMLLLSIAFLGLLVVRQRALRHDFA